MLTYVEKVCTLASCIFSMMLACGSTRLSRAHKCSTILSSLVGQPLAHVKKDTAYSLGTGLFGCCSVSLDLTRREVSQLCGDLLDLCLEGFHGALNGFNGCILLKETTDSLSLSLNIGFPLLDSLM